MACDPRTNLGQHLSLWRPWSRRLRVGRASSNVPGGWGCRRGPLRPPFTPLQDVTCSLTRGGDPRGGFVGQATQTRPGCPHTMPSEVRGGPQALLGVLLARGKSGQDPVTRQGVRGSSPLPLPSSPSPHSLPASHPGTFPRRPALQASQAPPAVPRPPSPLLEPEEIPHSLAFWVTPHLPPVLPARHLSRTFQGPLPFLGRWGASDETQLPGRWGASDETHGALDANSQTPAPGRP